MKNKIKESDNIYCPECNSNIPVHSGNITNDEYKCEKCQSNIVIDSHKQVISIKVPKIYLIISRISTILFLLPIYYTFVESGNNSKIIINSFSIFFILFFGIEVLRGIKYGVTLVYLNDIFKWKNPIAFKVGLFINSIFILIGFVILLIDFNR